MIAPELAKLAEQAKTMADTGSTTTNHHQNLSNAIRSHQEKNIEQLASTIREFTNPFLENSLNLMNLVTKVVVPENVKQNLCKQSTIGQTLFTNFVKDRIKQGKVSIWAPMKKRKLLTWKTTEKVLKVAAQSKTVELKEDRSLFAKMMMICKT